MTLFDLLTENLMRHEGLRLNPYKDTVGKVTIGYGRNLDDKGISKTEAAFLLSNDIRETIDEAKFLFPFLENLTENRQYVICNMLFNLGRSRLMGFRKMIEALEKGNYLEASQQMLDSRWATQVGDRARELAALMEVG